MSGKHSTKQATAAPQIGLPASQESCTLSKDFARLDDSEGHRFPPLCSLYGLRVQFHRWFSSWSRQLFKCRLRRAAPPPPRLHPPTPNVTLSFTLLIASSSSISIKSSLNFPLVPVSSVLSRHFQFFFFFFK